jgi:hypothetical protein
MPRLQPLPLNHLSAETAAVFDEHVQEQHSRITNMKATMGRSVLVFDIYMRWYDLYERVKTIIGARAAYLFAHAISLGSNCPLCTTYFRKAIIDNGENPSQISLTDAEQELLDFGSAIATKNGEVDNTLYDAVKIRYSETELVVLVGFAGQMIATNIFNNVFEVEIDEYLAPYVSMDSK